MKDTKYTAICPKCRCEFNLGTDISEVIQLRKRLSVIEAIIAHFWLEIKDSKGEDMVDITIGQDIIMDTYLKEIGEFINENIKPKQQEQ